jgi:hypothetical protein
MITFADARAVVAAKYLAEQDGSPLEPWVSEDGFENADYWQVVAGPKLWLVDGLDSFQPIDDIVRLVDKKTGEYLEVHALTTLNELATFTPVSVKP